MLCRIYSGLSKVFSVYRSRIRGRFVSTVTDYKNRNIMFKNPAQEWQIIAIYSLIGLIIHCIYLLYINGLPYYTDRFNPYIIFDIIHSVPPSGWFILLACSGVCIGVTILGYFVFGIVMTAPITISHMLIKKFKKYCKY
jgi:hypothetical protein